MGGGGVEDGFFDGIMGQTQTVVRNALFLTSTERFLLSCSARFGLIDGSSPNSVLLLRIGGSELPTAQNHSLE